MCNICSPLFHDWNEPQYESDDSCLQTKTCKICGYEEDLDDEVHEWSEPKYEDENLCQLVVRCQRCDYVQEIEEEKHDWSEPKYEDENSCQLVTICQRCGDVQKADEMHDWSDWEFASEAECVRHCHRCNKDEYQCHDGKVIITVCSECEGNPDEIGGTGCSVCDGTGYTEKECTTCDGAGKIIDG